MDITVEIAILGFGREGKAVLKFLRKTPQFKNADISILDKKLNKDYLNNLDKFDIVFRSPGVPYNLPEIQKAVKKGEVIITGHKPDKDFLKLADLATEIKKVKHYFDKGQEAKKGIEY